MQEFHPKTLLYTTPMSIGCNLALKRFEDFVDVVDHCCVDGAPLHLKIKADVANGDRQKTALKQQDIAELLMPRDWYLKSIDPDGKRPFGEVKLQMVKHAHQYHDLVMQRKTEGGYDLLDVLELYKSFYKFLLRTSSDHMG